jgi:flagellar biosynthetic protein FliP
MHTRDEFAFDPVLRDLAKTSDVATVTWVAKTLEYPVRGQFAGPAWPWSMTAELVLAGLLGAALAYGIVRLLRARPGLRRFLGHYLEMVLAMFAGMGILAVPWMLIWPGLSDRPVPDSLVMAANMTIGMAAWMALRGHTRRMICEMAAAMVAPFLLLLPPYATGAITTGTLMTAGHTLILLTMLAAMLLRRRDYTRHHLRSPWRRHHQQQRAPAEEVGARVGTSRA